MHSSNVQNQESSRPGIFAKVKKEERRWGISVSSNMEKQDGVGLSASYGPNMDNRSGLFETKSFLITVFTNVEYQRYMTSYRRASCSSATLTTNLPVFAPLNNICKDSGHFSIPFTMWNFRWIFPSDIQDNISFLAWANCDA